MTTFYPPWAITTNFYYMEVSPPDPDQGRNTKVLQRTDKKPAGKKKFKIPNILVVCDGTCAHCSEPLDNVCMCFAKPYMCVVHQRCAPFFNFKGGWPHQLPFDAYSTADYLTTSK